jgi:uracil-DNA glycosylase
MAEERDPVAVRCARLVDLYEDIWEWGRTKYDDTVIKKKVDAVDPNSRLFLVGEAYAKRQVRLTGINWFDQKGDLGPAGSNLQLVLGCLGYTVRPPVPVRIQDGWVRPRENGLSTAYTTDIFPCHPPSGGAPSGGEIADALKQGFLLRELELLQPKVILLLGDKGYRAFYKNVLQRKVKESISDAFKGLGSRSRFEVYRGATVIPFFHPSPANGHFIPWLNDVGDSLCETPQIKAIENVLAD